MTERPTMPALDDGRPCLIVSTPFGTVCRTCDKAGGVDTPPRCPGEARDPSASLWRVAARWIVFAFCEGVRPVARGTFWIVVILITLASIAPATWMLINLIAASASFWSKSHG